MKAFYTVMNGCIGFNQNSDSNCDEHVLLQQNRKCFDPVSIIAILIFSFTLIHPLPDGNGRTHRLLVHYLLEQFNILDSWLIPVSIIILHDNATTGNKDRVLRSVSIPLVRRVTHEFVDGALVIRNKTKNFYEAWDATDAVEYFYQLMDKAVRISIDCGLYLNIWDRCQVRLKDLESRLSPSQLKHVISGYLQLGRISKNIVKRYEKVGISVGVLDALGEICQRQLADDPHAFKEHFEPFNINNIAEAERATVVHEPDETDYVSA
jgi:hypothetical protein